MKKRGRPKKSNSNSKTKKKIQEKTKKLFDIKEMNDLQKTEYTNLLVHLPIDISLIENNKTESYEQEYLNYKNLLSTIEKEPEPFESIETTDLIEEKIIQSKEIKVLNDKILLNEKNIKKTVYMIEKKEQNILCWWCCHNYENQSFGIPLRKDKDIFVTKGYFCSLNCAKSYNDNENIDLKIKQNRNLLIEMLNKEISNDDKEVIKSPPRETLKVFGGVLTIEEFRKNGNILKLIYPPLITIIPYIEEIKTEENNKNIKINKKLIKNNLLKLFN